ncbi:MAG: holo-ACP synthase [Waddliaceae bacterium]
MPKGVGTDIIEIQRIERVIDKHGEKFLNRLFTEKEQSYCLRHQLASQHFAGRFAAKEAVAKALGTGISGGIRWLDIEIDNDANGKPQVTLSPSACGGNQHPRFLLSISHSKHYATAVAIRL